MQKSPPATIAIATDEGTGDMNHVHDQLQLHYPLPILIVQDQEEDLEGIEAPGLAQVEELFRKDVERELTKIHSNKQNRRPLNKRKAYAIMLVWVLVVTATFSVITTFYQKGQNSSNNNDNISNQAESAKSIGDGETTTSSGWAETGNGNAGVDVIEDGGVADSPRRTDSPTTATMLRSSASPSPTTAPTASPSQCINTIASLKSCYPQKQKDNAILASFTQCNPGDLDWVGIYEEGSTALFLGDQYLGWTYTCGEDQDCGGAPRIQNSALEMDDSLEPGMYQLYLVLASPDGAPYTSIATSSSFEIANSCP